MKAAAVCAFTPGFWLAAIMATSAGLGCTFSPRIPDGKISCAKATDCPREMYCVLLDGSNVCRSSLIASPDAKDTAAVDSGNDKDASRDSSAPMDVPAGGAGGSGGSGGSTVTPDAATDVASEARPDMGAETPVSPCGNLDLTTGLLFFLPLDDGGSNPVVEEASPHNLEALINNLPTGATWTTGHFGSALSLTGGGGDSGGAWIRVGGAKPASPWLNTASTGFSFSVWAKFPRGKPADGVILSRRAEGARGYLYRIMVYGGALRAQLYNTNGNNSDIMGNQALPTDGAWMHIAGSYAAGIGAGGFQVFVNGISVGKDPLFALSLGDENTPALIGGAEDPAALLPSTTIIDRLHGTIDDVAVWARTLPVAAIKALACGARPQP